MIVSGKKVWTMRIATVFTTGIFSISLAFLIVKPAMAIDWCTSAPLPTHPTYKLYHNWDEYRLDPVSGWGESIWDNHKLPTRVWCFVHDDQHPPRSGQCRGLGESNCLQGWVVRRVGPYGSVGVFLNITNQHSRDTRWATIISDAPQMGQH
jgi:hypothetical protein